MNFCMPGLTSVGTGIDFAGTSRGASGESPANAAAGKATKGAQARAASVSSVHLFSGMCVSFPYMHCRHILILGGLTGAPVPAQKLLGQKAVSTRPIQVRRLRATLQRGRHWHRRRRIASADMLESFTIVKNSSGRGSLAHPRVRAGTCPYQGVAPHRHPNSEAHAKQERPGRGGGRPPRAPLGGGDAAPPTSTATTGGRAPASRTLGRRGRRPSNARRPPPGSSRGPIWRPASLIARRGSRAGPAGSSPGNRRRCIRPAARRA